MKEKMNSKKIYNWIWFLIIFGVVVFANILGTVLYSRFDMTEDERYSLTEGTINFLDNMQSNEADSAAAGPKVNRVYIKIYLEGNLPAGIKRFRNAIEDKLKEFKNIAGDRIEYEFIDPNVGTEDDKNALFENLYNKGKGILPLDMSYEKDGSESNLELWPGAEIEYNGETKNYIQFLPGTPVGQSIVLTKEYSETTVQNSINNLEYMLITALRRTIQTYKPHIALLKGHGELSMPETMRARSLVEEHYAIDQIELNNNLRALENYNGVIIARPLTAYSEKDLYILDQFVLRGGRLMVFMDKLSFPKDSLNMKGMAHTTRTSLGLDKLLFDYGIKMNDNYVLDAQCTDILVPFARQGRMPWYFYLRASTTNHPITRNIEPVMLRYASQIQLMPDSKRVMSPILTSSSNSTVTGLAPLISLGMPMNFGENPAFNENPKDPANKLCLAGLAEGKFTSHFKNRIIDAFAKNSASGYRENSTNDGKVLVVSNGDFIRNIYDSMPGKEGKMLYRPIQFNNLRFDEVRAQQRLEPIVLGNQEFFQNMVDYMMGDNSVLDIRSKQIDIHPINKEKVKTDGGFYTFLNIVLPSGLVLLLALIIFYLRKRRFARS